jgi:hypothetical protein
VTVIAFINESTKITDAEIQAMVPAFRTQWNRDLVPAWRIDPAAMVFYPKGTAPAPGTWWTVFLDNSGQAGALAYHDLTNAGLPISKVFVEAIQSANESVTVGASHELAEMAFDPWLNNAFQDNTGTFWAAEIADPVEDDSYGYTIDGVLVTDFITPNWFGHEYAGKTVDHMSHAHAQFQVLPGGYAQKFEPNQGWVQVTGNLAAKSICAVAPHGSRRDRRARGWRNWKKSEAKFA